MAYVDSFLSGISFIELGESVSAGFKLFKLFKCMHDSIIDQAPELPLRCTAARWEVRFCWPGGGWPGAGCSWGYDRRV